MHLLILSVAAYSMFFSFSNFLENAALMSCALRTIESDLRTYTDVDIMGTGYKPEKIQKFASSSAVPDLEPSKPVDIHWVVVLHILVIIFNHHRKPNISRSCRLFHHFSSSAKPEQLTCCTVVLHDVNYVNYSITDINIRIIIVIIFRIWLVLAGYEKLDGDLKPVRNGEVLCMKKILLTFHYIALIILPCSKWSWQLPYSSTVNKKRNYHLT